MKTRKRIKALTISFIIILLVVLIVFNFLMPYFAKSFVNVSIGYKIPTKINNSIIFKISDSLKETKWKYNPPRKWKNKITVHDSMTYKMNSWFFIKKTDSTESFMFNLKNFTTSINVIYTDTARLHHLGINLSQEILYGTIIKNTLFKDIEDEALKRGMSNSEIYLDKETLEEFGYHDFAKRIYPTKKFLFWEY